MHNKVKQQILYQIYDCVCVVRVRKLSVYLTDFVTKAEPHTQIHIDKPELCNLLFKPLFFVRDHYVDLAYRGYK